VNELQAMEITDRGDQNRNVILALIDEDRQDRGILEFTPQILILQIDVQADLRQLQHIVKSTPINKAIANKIVIFVAITSRLFGNFDVLEGAVDAA
jgi:hypothetical protein